MTSAPLVLFDGDCRLCNGAVTFLLAHDRGALRFASLQSATGQRILRQLPSPPAESMLFLEDGHIFDRSTAALRITRWLRWPYRLLGALALIPRPVRDAMYDWVARNRRRWLGPAQCQVTSPPETRDRFID